MFAKTNIKVKKDITKNYKNKNGIKVFTASSKQKAQKNILGKV